MKEDAEKEKRFGFFDENNPQIASIFYSVSEVVGNTIKTLSLQKKKEIVESIQGLQLEYRSAIYNRKGDVPENGFGKQEGNAGTYGKNNLTSNRLENDFSTKKQIDARFSDLMSESKSVAVGNKLKDFGKFGGHAVNLRKVRKSL